MAITRENQPELLRVWPLVLLAVMTVLLASCRTQDNTVPAVETQDRIIASITAVTGTPAAGAAALNTESNAQSNTESNAKQSAEGVAAERYLIKWFGVECETFEEVVVSSEADYINLNVKVILDINECPAQTPSETVIELNEPLGERQFWDKSVNRIIKVQAD